MLKSKEEKKIERSNTQKILRAFSNRVRELGFNRVKQRQCWVRESLHTVEFLHIHKYSFGPYFRVHTCLRLYNSSLEFVGLLGPTEKELALGTEFSFKNTPESIQKCSADLFNYVEKYSEAWFAEFRTAENLLSNKNIYFSSKDIEELNEELNHGRDQSRERTSRDLFDL